ncbi:Retrovirus-related Pol polyprotein from transposon TNT 1-94, partial [Araneus ventricosus]
IEVWKLVELPKDEKPTSCKWVLRIKRNNVYKARLVARGFKQKPGIDYLVETYAPVISTSSLRLVLTIIIQKNLEMYALNVKTAFLNGDLQETLYMEQPMGYNDNSGRVGKLLKSLYGLKQTSRQWFNRLTDFIIHLNFQQLNCEACIFVRRSKQSEIFIVLHVNDLLIAGSDHSEVGVTIQLIRNEFEMSKAEVANEFLGISFEYSHNKLSLGQKGHVEKILSNSEW